jgi:hypothetical protein
MAENRVERVQFILSADELVALDDFRYRERIPSRNSAVRELLKRGLTAEGFASAAFGAKSEDFRVNGSTPKGRNGRQRGRFRSE